MDTLFGLANPVSSLTHGFVVVALVLCVPWLLRRAGESRTRTLAVLLYVACVGSMLVASSTYHALPNAHSLKSTFWHLDHGMIWVSIAATYTALPLLCLRLEGRRRHLGLMWTVALTGSALELSVLESLPMWVSPLLYVAMGWICFPVLLALFREHGRYPAALLLTGGVVVSMGGVIDSLSAPNLWPGVFEAHELLHVTTVFGWYCHWWPICQATDGRFEPATAPEQASVEPALS